MVFLSAIEVSCIKISRMRSSKFEIIADQPSFIIAEISGNHNGELNTALELIESAARCGAQAVKFQTYTADTLSLDSENDFFTIDKNSPWAEYGSQFKLYKKAHTPWDWFPELFDHARDCNLIPFSSPFDETAVEFLESLSAQIYKVASPEINHIPLLQAIAKTKKPIILSLGVASQHDLKLAVRTIRELSDSQIIVLQCDTAYPSRPENANLNLLPTLRKEFNCIVGISDHTTDSSLVSVAIGAGAKVFEKHLRLEGQESVDDFFSLNESQFIEYVKQVRDAEKSLGISSFRYEESSQYRRFNTRSIFASKHIKRGEIFTNKNIKVVRPGLGLSPLYFNDLLGKRANRDIEFANPLTELDLDHE